MNGDGWVYLQHITELRQFMFPDASDDEALRVCTVMAAHQFWSMCIDWSGTSGGFVGHVHTPRGVPAQYA